jgi:hypothetical protein
MYLKGKGVRRGMREGWRGRVRGRLGKKGVGVRGMKGKRKRERDWERDGSQGGWVWGARGDKRGNVKQSTMKIGWHQRRMNRQETVGIA